MPTKQSNKQTQNVSVVVNNKMCCDKPKPKKRRAKPKPPQEPIDEFPVLNTPAQTRPNYGPMAMPIRNTVYMPSSVQISPDGMQPPIPEYFNRPYTNLVRTMEDMRTSIMNEVNDVKMLVGSRPMTNEMGTDPQDLSTINPNPFGSPTETPTMAQQPKVPVEEPRTPNSAMTTPSPSMTYEQTTSPFMSFMMNRQYQEPNEITPLPIQSPLPRPRNQSLTMNEPQTVYDIPYETQEQRYIRRFPEYLQQFNNASNKKDKGKAFDKIKKVGRAVGVIETRGAGNTMEVYVGRVAALVPQNI